jgi:hypothetical protein
MGRISAVRREDRSGRLADNLIRNGLREPSARRVSKVYEERGAGAALVELYRMGWKVCRKGEDEFVLVRGADEKVGEEDFEE